jgi:hypothetical protein
VLPLSNLTSCTPTKSNLYLANSLTHVVSESDLYRLHTFYVLNLISLFHCIGLTKGSVLVQGTCICFVKRPVFMVSWYYLAQPQAGGPPLVGSL